MGSGFLPNLTMADYDYDLPDEQIARYPLANREDSRLIVYNGHHIHHQKFKYLPGLLPANSVLAANDTKVIPARLEFTKNTGAEIEIFLLTPVDESGWIWEAMVGNRSKFKEDEMLELSKIVSGETITLSVAWWNREKNIVQLQSNSGHKIEDCLGIFGKVPLPPYLNREAETEDWERYQSVFAINAGAVAAPTASLHFTRNMWKQLEIQGHSVEFLTLHVGAGTFRPVSSPGTAGHQMHAERFVVSEQLLQRLKTLPNGMVPVGTTSMRVLESLRFVGARSLLGMQDYLHIQADDGYNPALLEVPWPQALNECIRICKVHGHLQGLTSIFIMPGFQFSASRALITNFHQPASTLVLLVAAFIGPVWREVYNQAIRNGYRFLSYGDACLFIPDSGTARQ
ncbi:MAG: S-adenosylmethionine:tRNA ribosyltransferase-isomerase [Bacteroidetes bacterium]|nr:S-adenosylmethionine:tRNA ribosyltransferase-isomerase [Bacteroidota bacterium]